jgi:hypothetical protein
MVGTTALRIRASFIDSWPTIAVKGKLWRSSVMLTWFRLVGGRKKGWEAGGGVGLGGGGDARVGVARNGLGEGVAVAFGWCWGCSGGCCARDGLGRGGGRGLGGVEDARVIVVPGPGWEAGVVVGWVVSR